MKLKRYSWLAVCLFLFIFIGVLPAYSRSQTGFQVSTLGALNVGVYEGATTLEKLKSRGDFGLGTIGGLDGEMVILDGKFYQVKADGVAYPVEAQAKTPFSTVTFFRKGQSLRLTGQMNYQELRSQIDKQLSTLNLPYAVRLQGTFPALKVRSVPKQTPPYRRLSDVLSQEQKTFELRDVRGTLVGFRLPQYLKDVNAAGYHFHFITRDRKKGGHVLDGEFLNAVADVAALRDWRIMLPNHSRFDQATLE